MPFWTLDAAQTAALMPLQAYRWLCRWEPALPDLGSALYATADMFSTDEAAPAAIAAGEPSPAWATHVVWYDFQPEQETPRCPATSSPA